MAGDGEAALSESGVFEPDAVVLDLGLPLMDGVEVCRRLREDGDVPILMLTARDAVDARVEGLDSGADDYLVKPFEREELLARVRALLRRRPPRGSAFLVAGDLRLNPDTHEVFRDERALELTAREFELLEHLMRNERIVVSRQALLDEVWGYHPFAETNTVDVFISNLRRKLEAGGEPRVLHTVRGAGYVLRAPVRTRLPVRLKVAVVTAALTFAILCLFAIVIGAVAEQRIRDGFDDDLRATAADLQDDLSVEPDSSGRQALDRSDEEVLNAYSSGGAVVRIVNLSGGVVTPRRRPARRRPGRHLPRRRPARGVASARGARARAARHVRPHSPPGGRAGGLRAVREAREQRGAAP